MFRISIDYPSKDEEIMIVGNRQIDEDYKIKEGIIKRDEIMKLQNIVREIPAGSNIERLVVRILRNTRPGTSSIKNVKEMIKWGASPRAGIYMLIAAKAHALIKGRLTPDIEDVKKVLPMILEHRLILSFKGEMENISKGDIINEIIKNSV